MVVCSGLYSRLDIVLRTNEFPFSIMNHHLRIWIPIAALVVGIVFLAIVPIFPSDPLNSSNSEADSSSLNEGLVSTSTPGDLSGAEKHRDQILKSDRYNNDAMARLYTVLETSCPYFLPDGDAYHKCLSEQVSIQDDFLKTYLDSLVNDMKIMITEVHSRSDQRFDTTKMEELREAIIEFSASWKETRDSACKLENSDSVMDEDYEGILNTCKLMVLESHYGLAYEIWYNWVRGLVMVDVSNRTKVNTLAYTDLMKRVTEVSSF